MTRFPKGIIMSNSTAKDEQRIFSATDHDVMRARLELSHFVLDEAERTVRRLGFGWVGTSSAPSTYADLRGAFARSAEQKTPLPVSSENLVFPLLLMGGRVPNLALRFWHDVSHVERERTFATVDELDLGLWHVAVAGAAGLSKLALQLLEADLVGQSLLYAAIKGYATNQLDFDMNVLTFGFADAIVIEKERQELAAA